MDVPLVLHGGSNNPDKEIGESVTLGICKINISSDIKVTYFEKMREVLQNKGLRADGDLPALHRGNEGCRKAQAGSVPDDWKGSAVQIKNHQK